MNSEQHITAYFKAQFSALARRNAQARKGKEKITGRHPLRVETSTAYNIACEVLGAVEAGELADKCGL